jgi:transketolase
MSVSDMAYFRSLTRVDSGGGVPACLVFHPADAVCAYRCCELMANVDGMCFLRTHRPNAPLLYDADERFELRGCKQLRQGVSLTLASSGFMLHTVLAAASKLVEREIACSVFDVYTLPVDATPILEAARQAGGTILCIEDNYAGGVHAELAEAAAASGDVRVVGMTATRIPKSAKTAGELFAYVGIGVDQIVETATGLAS